jgi:hypothetical protein
VTGINECAGANSCSQDTTGLAYCVDLEIGYACKCALDAFGVCGMRQQRAAY